MKRRTLSWQWTIDCSIKICWLLLTLMQLASAQGLQTFSGNSSRVVGHGVFSRVCTYNGPSSLAQLEWLKGESQIGSTTTQNTLLLSINNPMPSQGGEYHCRATFSDSTMPIEISGGFLNLYSEQSITAPATQDVIAGNNITLQCSSVIPGTHATWEDSQDDPFSGRVISANLTHNGNYMCTIVESSTGGTPIYTTVIHLQVIVPPTILERPAVQSQYMNEPETFPVVFQSSFEADTSINWLLDNRPLAQDSIIVTQYNDENRGMTSLQFSPLTRADSGTYSVTISNSRTLIPEHMKSATHVFNVDVFVPPARPSTPVIDSFNNDTRSRISWNLTEHTVDATPDSITVTIEGHPMSPVHLDPGTRQLVIDTEPGDNYVITVAASNVDGQIESPTTHLTLPVAAPRVNSLSAIRLNDTAFNFTLDVLYTGAGTGTDLTLLNIRFREDDSSEEWVDYEDSVDLTRSPHHRNIWYAIVASEQFAAIEEVLFSVVIQNIVSRGITMTTRQLIVVPGPPEDIRALTSTANSLTLQARLSTVGTAPIISVHFVLTPQTAPSSSYNATEDLSPGGLVTLEAGGLLPSTSYSVQVFAINAAGRGDSSMTVSFSTSDAASVLPLWIILVIAIVGSIVVVILLLLLLVSCCCRRHNNKKINITSSAQAGYQKEYERPGPLGAENCVDLVRTNSNYCYGQKGMQGFVLDPPPSGYFPPRSPTEASNIAMSTPYSIVKPQLQNSSSESETSDQSSKFNHFNFHHSPIPPSALHYDKIEYRSMPVLDDPDLSPTMPPNCATDV